MIYFNLNSDFDYPVVTTVIVLSDVNMSFDVCRMVRPDIAGKTEFVTGKKTFKRENLVYHNKSQKNEKCFNIWYQQKSIP